LRTSSEWSRFDKIEGKTANNERDESLMEEI
jgi:hypothetical protein